jgi:uncharacterized membrane protein YphA (DoxX/SURF4 family)
MSLFVTIFLIVLALPFLASGVMKLVGAPAMRKSAEHLGLSYPAYRGIGALEVLGAAGLVAGLAWWPLSVAAAVGLCLLMVGAVIYHRRAHDSVAEFAPAAVLAVLALVAAVLTPLAA